MTDNITLPRSVVEQALEALKYERDANNPLDWHHDKTMTALCAALEQPQVNSPEIPEGWRLVPVKPTEDMLSAVAWPGCAATDWEHMLAAAPQPPVELEPAIYPEEAFDMGLEAIPYYTHPQNLRCKSTQARLATLWGYERPQPKREPLTDAQINDHRLALAYDSEDLPDPWDFKQGVRAAERAHGIGGEA